MRHKDRVLNFIMLSVIVLVFTQSLCAANPVPLVIQASPTSVRPGGPAFTLNVTGSGFVSGSVVNWNGSPRATTFHSKDQVSASVAASDIATAATAWITVVNPGPGGGTSNLAFLPINTPISRPTFTTSNWGADDPFQAIVTGDFNGDGHLDVAAADIAFNQLWVLLGNGDGTFQPAVPYVAGDTPMSLATGDFNGDGKLDLVMANQSGCGLGGSVSVFLGNGDGTFQNQVEYATGHCPQMAIVGDFNGDGKLDLAVASLGDNAASVLLGNGDGTFQSYVDYAAASNATSITTGDFNRDGKLDLAVAGVGEISILLGKGDGTFLSQTPFSSTARFSITAADLNHDGKLDLVGTNDSGTIGGAVVMLGNGDGTFGPATVFTTGRNPIYVTVADLNNDGKLDLTLTNANSNTLSILFGNGDGTFKRPATNYTTGPNPAALAAGDINGDGRLDLPVLVANQSPTLTLFLQ
ncbi:MAG TPA: VCBS repeat-containing protein [Terriglobia bacterium]|nr:VCBS repeat-containing protein [Terriglobia bacterium]